LLILKDGILIYFSYTKAPAYWSYLRETCRWDRPRSGKYLEIRAIRSHQKGF